LLLFSFFRQISVQWHFRHSPLADALFAHCATNQREVADPLSPEANLPLKTKQKKKKQQPSRPPTASTDNDESDDDDDDDSGDILSVEGGEASSLTLVAL